MICPFKFTLYGFEGGQDCIGIECGMHKLCNAENEITAVEFNALDEHAQALERENEELRKLCGANDTLAAENDVSAASVDANDGSELQDSREKLEAEIDDWCAEHFNSSFSGKAFNLMLRWLDRQAAITKAEQREWWGGVVAEVQAKVDELTTENAKLSSDELHLRNALAQSEHELAALRDKLGRMLDNAHEITRIGGDC